MRPPPGHGSGQDGLTGTPTKAAIRQALTARINAAGRRAGVHLLGWQVRSLIATLLVNGTAPTDAEIAIALMRANWFPKPRRRQWRVGEGGGWATRS